MECGDSETQKAVNKLMPQKVKKRRKVQTEEGVSKDCVGSFGAFFFLVFVNNSFLLVIVYIHAESSHGHHKIKIKKEAKANTLSNDLFVIRWMVPGRNFMTTSSQMKQLLNPISS